METVELCSQVRFEQTLFPREEKEEETVPKEELVS